MLIKTNETWIDPTQVRAVRPDGPDGVIVFFKTHGDAMYITGINVATLALRINEALSSPLIWED